jgi:hypothetical protein
MEPTVRKDLTAPQPLLAQANLERIRGQWAEAVETCVRVLRDNPGNADAHSLLGDIYRDQGEIDDAIQWYRMAVDLRPAGPDVEKLRKLEVERERRAAQSGLLTAAAATDNYETAPAGTSQLMGYSPKRWLNTLTIVSACFLGAALIVLAVLRTSPAGRGDTLPQPLNLSSHPMMPTADTGVRFSSVNPNRPAVLPSGEQPKLQEKPHETGSGLAPDRPNRSRTAPVTAQPPASSAAPPPAPVATNHELPPASVQLIQPLNPSAIRAQEGAPQPQGVAPSEQPAPGAPGAAGRTEERDPNVEREPRAPGGAATPATDAGAGGTVNGGGAGPLP